MGLLVFFVYMMFHAFPWTSNSIKHEEAIRDLLLDEEFSYDEVLSPSPPPATRGVLLA